MAIIRNTKDLGACIRSARKAHGYTQARLAELAGVGVVYISQLENGKETAEIGKALNLLQLLSVDLEATDRRAATASAYSAIDPSDVRHPGEDVARDERSPSGNDPESIENTFLAIPSLLVDDGQTYALPADRAFWYSDEGRNPSRHGADGL